MSSGNFYNIMVVYHMAYLWGAKVDKNPNTILTQNKIKSRRLAAAKK